MRKAIIKPGSGQTIRNDKINLGVKRGNWTNYGGKKSEKVSEKGIVGFCVFVFFFSQLTNFPK